MTSSVRLGVAHTRTMCPNTNVNMSIEVSRHGISTRVIKWYHKAIKITRHILVLSHYLHHKQTIQAKGVMSPYVHMQMYVSLSLSTVSFVLSSPFFQASIAVFHIFPSISSHYAFSNIVHSLLQHLLILLYWQYDSQVLQAVKICILPFYFKLPLGPNGDLFLEDRLHRFHVDSP